MLNRLKTVHNYWVVEQRNHWGDYGDVLISGYARYNDDDGVLELHRTGPFLPPIFFPWLSLGGHAAVVSEKFKNEIEKLGLEDVQFDHARNSRIIRLAWEQWNIAGVGPEVYPKTGEPEDYIWEKLHDQECAAEMQNAFELVLSLWPVNIRRRQDAAGTFLDEFYSEVKCNLSLAPPLFCDREEYGYTVVSDTIKEWLTSKVGEWVRFSPVQFENGFVE
jgi:hypothetical protein